MGQKSGILINLQHETLLLSPSFLAAIVVGCTQSTAPVAGSSDLWKDPSIGSEFVLNDSYTDTSLDGVSSGNSVIAYQVLDSNMTIGGKTHVMEFTGGLYAAYEQNGDFSIGDSTYTYDGYEYVSGFQWIAFPTASGGTINDRPIDSVDYAYGDTMIQRGSRSFVDRETLTIGGRQFQAVKIALHYYSADYSSSGRSETTENSFAWFIPEIGFFGKETMDIVSHNTDPYSPSYDHQTGLTELSMFGKESHGKSSVTPQFTSSSVALKSLFPKRTLRSK